MKNQKRLQEINHELMILKKELKSIQKLKNNQ